MPLDDERWAMDRPVDFVFMPAGQHTIEASWGGTPVRVSVLVDGETAGVLQRSFDRVCAEEPLGCFGDEEHSEKQATMRLNAGRTRFRFGELRGERGIICSGAEPTSYGVELVNGKVYKSWSPCFESDADYARAERAGGFLVFPKGARGSESNPARVTGLSCVVGGLTNKPAFTSMPAIKAARVWGRLDEVFRPILARRDAAEATVEKVLRRNEEERSRRLFEEIARTGRAKGGRN
jgi:hypothetical protein